jgi:endoglucanase
MKKNLVIVLLVFGLFSVAFADEIFLDQLGYLLNSAKIAFVEGAPKQFKISDPRGEILLAGNKSTEIFDSDTGKTIAGIDFSELTAPGNYYLYFGQARRDLTIAKDPYEKVLVAVLKSFNLQSCGRPIDDRQTGLRHKACHTHDAQFHSSTGKKGRKNVTGGWHDAGDYGKYVSPANYAVSTLLFYCKINKAGKQVLLKELRRELDWLLAMQDAESGGVYHKVTRKNFEPFYLPDQDKEPRYIFRVSSAATAGFAGTMAQAYLSFKGSDPQYANKLLAAALRAWQFLKKNQNIVPPGGFDNDPEVKTGVYGDIVDGDERLFASAQLLGATGDPKYNEYYVKNYGKYDPSDTTKLGWQDFRHHAYVSYLLLPVKVTSSEIRAKVRQRFISFADNLVRRAKGNGFGVVLKGQDYRWGSNGLLMDYAKALIFAHLFTGKMEYKKLALEQLHYILGRNAHDICFVTGFGKKTVTQLHHRPLIASRLELPGFLAGGPNKYLQDEVVRTVFHNDTPPAMVYLDDKDSYSTNENSIYWNASLALVVGYFIN